VHANILQSSKKTSSLVDFMDVKKAVKREYLHTEYENGAYGNIRIVAKDGKVAKNSQANSGFETFVNSEKLSAK